MAFKSDNPPMWFKIIVRMVIVIMAIGLFFMATRNGIQQRVMKIDFLDGEIIRIMDERNGMLSTLCDNLSVTAEEELQQYGVGISSHIPADTVLLLYVDERSEFYNASDEMLNDLVARATIIYENELPQSLLRPIRAVMELEGELDEMVADYHEQIDLYDRGRSSIVNIPAASVMDLPDFSSYDILDALKSPY